MVDLTGSLENNLSSKLSVYSWLDSNSLAKSFVLRLQNLYSNVAVHVSSNCQLFPDLKSLWQTLKEIETPVSQDDTFVDLSDVARFRFVGETIDDDN